MRCSARVNVCVCVGVCVCVLIPVYLYGCCIFLDHCNSHVRVARQVNKLTKTNMILSLLM